MNTSMLLALDLIDNVTAAIGSLLYGLFSIFFSLIDWVQGIFCSLAGLAPIKIDGEIVNAEGSNETYDIVYYLLQTDIIRDIFFSMVIFSIILMFLMVGLSIIRNAYQDKPKPIMSIVGKCFTGMLGILLIPIACLAGLMFGNLILMAVDSATGAGGSQKLSGTLFLSSAYNANWLRDEDLEKRVEALTELKKYTNIKDVLDSKYMDMSEHDLHELEEGEWELLATSLDEAYVSGELVYKNAPSLSYGNKRFAKLGYNLMDVNYIVLVVGGVLMLGFIFKMCFGMINRIFKLCVDFVLIPVVMGMLPFDDNPSKAWKKDFISQTTLAYGTVGALNLYFSILPIVDKIELVSGNGAWFNMFFNLALEILGLFAAESMVKTISGWFGTGDLIGEGTTAWKTFNDKGLKKISAGAGKVTKGIGRFVGAGMANKQQGAGARNIGRFFAGGFKDIGSRMKSNVEGNSIVKSWGEGTKAGKEGVENFDKYGMAFTKEGKERNEARYNAASLQREYQKTLTQNQEAFARGEITSKELEQLNKAATSKFLTNFDANNGTYNVIQRDAAGNVISSETMTAQTAQKRIEQYEKDAEKQETAISSIKEIVELEMALEAATDEVNALIDSGATRAEIAVARQKQVAMQRRADATDRRRAVSDLLTMLGSETIRWNGVDTAAGSISYDQIMAASDAQINALYNTHLLDVNAAQNSMRNAAREAKASRQQGKRLSDAYDDARAVVANDVANRTADQTEKIGKESKK